MTIFFNRRCYLYSLERVGVVVLICFHIAEGWIFQQTFTSLLQSLILAQKLNEENRLFLLWNPCWCHRWIMYNYEKLMYHACSINLITMLSTENLKILLIKLLRAHCMFFTNWMWLPWMLSEASRRWRRSPPCTWSRPAYSSSTQSEIYIRESF